MPLHLALLVPTLLFGGCGTTAVDHVTLYPVLTTSQDTVSFDEVDWGATQTRQFTVSNKGDLPMGIHDIVLGTDTMADNWSVAYNFDDVVCPDGSDTGDSGSASDGGASDGGASDGGASDGGAAPIMPISADTGGGWAGGGDTGSGSTGQVLNPGCILPVNVTLKPNRVGNIYGAVTIHTADEQVGRNSKPTYFADPDSSFATVVLQGSAIKGTPNAYVTPRAVDFHTVWEGTDVTQVINVSNVGTGTLQLDAPYLDAGCDNGYSLDWTYSAGTVLSADQIAGVQVHFTASSTSSSSCILWIPSDDPDEPLINIPIQANTGTDPAECAPKITMISPTPGYEHLVPDPLAINFKVYDCNQPATSLKLSIRSGVLNVDHPILVPTFYATNESGYVEASVPRDKLLPGTDTLIVRAQDSAGNTTDAGVSILYRATYPASDDDGDGFGTDGETALDCDDTDINSFPSATEIYDGKDNNCDGVIDEGTAGHDDDGDGFSEAEGDCDDNDPNTNPKAVEIPDYRDNNCDGRIDENTTLSDDDGDGYSEADGDCNDADPAIHPGAIEYCDGIDNDCNGLSDERDGCVDLNSSPIIFGCIQTDYTTIEVGKQAHLSAFVVDPDGDQPGYAWEQDSKLTDAGYVSLDTVSGASPTFTAPDTLPNNKVSESYHFNLRVSDPAGNVDYCAIDLTVTAEPVSLGETTTTMEPNGGCGSSKASSNALFVPGLLGLLALSRRRRKGSDKK